MLNLDRPANPNRLALCLAVLNGFGMVAAFSVAVILAASAQNLDLPAANSQALALPMISLAWVSGLVGLILLIGLLHAAARYQGKTLPTWKGARWFRPSALALIVGWPPALLLGQALAQDVNDLTLLLLPVCLILAVTLPTWWLLDYARRGLPTPAHRMWGVGSVVVLGALPLALVIEFIFILIGSLVVVGMISNQPALMENLNSITRDFSRGLLNAERLSALVEPFLQNPGVVVILVSGLSVVVPLIEEALKPLGLWFLAKRGFSPAQGFVLGATSGAFFALLEGLTTLGAVSGAEWFGLALGRAGTSLLHITCSALMGWGLALAWTRTRYAAFTGLFLLSVVIHGTWNGFAQFLGVMPLLSQPAMDAQSSGLSEIAVIVVMGILLLAALVILTLANRHLNRALKLEEAAALAAQRTEPQPEVLVLSTQLESPVLPPPDAPQEGETQNPPAQSHLDG